MNYQIKKSVKIDFVDDEVLIFNVETGFSGKGNRSSYNVLKLMENPIGEDDIIKTLQSKYDVSQHERIAKSVPKIIIWAQERELIDIIS